METKFTPGPWKCGRWDERGSTRFYISQEEGAPYTPNYSDVATLIAETVPGERKEIQEANARLIAAAPDLLEALQRLSSQCDRLRLPDQSMSDAERAAKAAIAKAAGGNHEA